MTAETKSDALGTAVLAAMRTAIEQGMSPVEAVDTGLMAIGSIGIQAEGEFKFGAKLIVIGECLVDGSPERAAKRSATSN
jgi:hypothetical protein